MDENVFIPTFHRSDRHLMTGITCYFSTSNILTKNSVPYVMRFSFSMTINKAEGQLLKVYGEDIQHPSPMANFYVACSRVGHQQASTCMPLVDALQMSFILKI